MSQFEFSALIISLKVAFTAIVIFLPLAIFLGYFFSRFNFKGKFILEAIFSIPLVLPPIVTGFLLLIIFTPAHPLGKFLLTLGIRITSDWKGAVIAVGVVSFPILLNGIRISFAYVPQELEMVSYSLGKGKIATFFRVSLPLAFPGIVSSVFTAFARCLGDFGATIIVASNIEGKTQTLPLAIWQAINSFENEKTIWNLILISVSLSFLCAFLSYYFRKKMEQNKYVFSQN